MLQAFGNQSKWQAKMITGLLRIGLTWRLRTGEENQA